MSELPIDSDIDIQTQEGASADAQDSALHPRPPHERLGYLGLVAAGGVVGTAVREWLTLVVPPLGAVPIATFGINIVGAFVLGALLEFLGRGGPDEGRRRRLRLLFGTGVLGGFTTYSALADDTALLLGQGEGGVAVLYALATIVVGAAATLIGIVVAAAVHRRWRAAR
jgi:CrcB protein